MIDELRPYTEMKPSGLPWLGDVPAHWDVRRSKYVFQEVDRRSATGEENHLSMSQRHGLVPAEQITRSLISESYVGGKLVEENDLVLNRLKAHLGVFSYAMQSGLISPDYTVLRPKSGVDVRFFEALLKSPACRGELFTRAKGIVEGFWRLYTDDFYNIRVPYPPVEEQRLIVRFLDWHGGQVTRLVRAKKALIGLLNEQKQAIIYRAVTRGLDENAKLKPSGIPWLGDVPEGWEVKMIKHTSRIVRGKFTHRPRNDPALYDGPYPFIQTGAVARASMYISDFSQTLNEKGFAASKLFPKGTLCMTIAANIGDVAILDFDACFPDSVVGFIPKSGNELHYLYSVFKCMKPEFMAEAPVNTQGNLNVERIGAMYVAMPCATEQRAIVREIAVRSESWDQVIERTKFEIAFIQEFRTRMIADVVTGKLDVRTLAAHLPETAKQEASLNDQSDDDDLDDLPVDLEEEEAAA